MLNSLLAAKTLAQTNEYLEAFDYLNRMRMERKINEVNLEIFIGLYGLDMFNRFYGQGFFAFANN